MQNSKVKVKYGFSAEIKLAKTSTRKSKLYSSFGCPIFMLDAVLQGNLSIDSMMESKIASWHVPEAYTQRCKKCGIEHHNCDHILPQHHQILDDDFTAVQSMRVRKVPVN